MSKPYRIDAGTEKATIIVSDEDRAYGFEVGMGFVVSLMGRTVLEEARQIRSKLSDKKPPVWALERLDKFILSLR